MSKRRGGRVGRYTLESNDERIDAYSARILHWSNEKAQRRAKITRMRGRLPLRKRSISLTRIPRFLVAVRFVLRYDCLSSRNVGRSSPSVSLFLLRDPLSLYFLSCQSQLDALVTPEGSTRAAEIVVAPQPPKDIATVSSGWRDLELKHEGMKNC